VPALKSCKNLPKEPAELIVNQGWPATGNEKPDADLSQLFVYLQEIKSNIRIAHKKSSTAKKGKKVEPVTNCIIFFSMNFPEYQKKVLDILTTFEFVDNVIQGDYIVQIREQIKGKEQVVALKFAAHVCKEAETIGKE
jgi:hypothetical protein